jgi:nucleoside-diphosphate-sugar epimerase
VHSNFEQYMHIVLKRHFMNRTVLILGSRGRLGAALVTAFAAAGWRVIAQIRASAKPPVQPGLSHVTWLPVDMTDTAAFAQLGEVDVVVHALNPTYTRWASEAVPLLQLAIEVSLQYKATLMFPGNVYNFGAGMPALLHETTVQQPTSRKGAIRVDMEQRLKQASQTQGLRSIVVRAGDFLGCGTGSWFDLLVAKGAQRGRMGYAGPTGIGTAWAYVPDLAQTFVLLAQRRAQLGAFEVLHFAGYQLRREDWEQLMRKALLQLGWLQPQQAMKVQTMPWPLIRAMAWAVPAWREIAEMRYLWLTPHALDGSKLAHLLDAVPHTPIDEALQQALRQLYTPQDSHHNAPDEKVTALEQA